MKYLFSQFDYDELVKKFHDSAQRLKKSNIDAIESTEESSETWHDNWRFEEGVRQSMMLSKQLEDVRNVLINSKVIDKLDSRTLLGFKIKFKRGRRKREVIVGSYFTFSTNKNIASYSAPLIQALKGLKSGEQTRFGPRKELLIMISTEPFPKYFLSSFQK